jgi:hypothetical protein
LLYQWNKSSPKLWASSVIFKKLPKEHNQPMGENSPNLVTMVENAIKKYQTHAAWSVH